MSEELTKPQLKQLYGLTKLPGWPLLKDVVKERMLTKARQQWDKTGEKLAQISGEIMEAARLLELLEGYEKLGNKADEEED
jgi:hypothetical protein